MDAIRTFPPLRNDRTDAFRIFGRSGSGAANEVPASSSAEQSAPQVKLHVRGVSKTYGTSTVLKPLDLKVMSGELLAVLGPSGSGKTTLLQIICGLVEPSGGRLVIDGRDETDNPANKRDIGVVFQNYALFPHLTVYENVAFPLQMRKLAQAKLRNRVEETLAMVGLSDFAKRFPRELSGGQQQRVALARCFVYRPSLILMDESLSALDKKLRDSMRIEIKRLHRETGATIIFVTHDQEEALALADRICLMNDGRIEQLGAPDEIYERPASTFVADFIGASNLIHGEVAADGTFDTPDGRVPLPPGQMVAAGSKAALVIRPEKLELCARDDAYITGHVEETIYAGSETRLLVRLGSGNLMTTRRAAGQPPVSIGEPIFMRWDRTHARLLEGAPPVT
ncbi:putative spermidine/putrescine transport system ATP-binding protein [Bradyrhizobium sp. F1.4.3]|uniref:ABC transporter ATP-binding protein n=1 Tax=Bradyrhizobium sp. F1.4.3 TaxID=3156356 RepID=UPI003390B18D